jgi:ribosomal protein S21
MRASVCDANIVTVDGNLNGALKVLARRMQTVLADRKRKSRYVPPSESRRAKSLMARRRLKRSMQRQRESEERE